MTKMKSCETCGQSLSIGSKAEAAAEAARAKAATVTETDLDALDDAVFGPPDDTARSVHGLRP